MPTASPNPVLGSILSGSSVTLDSSAFGVTIRYTTNGSEPNESSPEYVSPIPMSVSMTIKAKTFRAGWTPSDTATFSYTVKVNNPVSNVASGSVQSGTQVTLSGEAGAVIRYTTDGTVPTTDSQVYSSPITITAITRLVIKAFKPGLADSDAVLYVYNVSTLAPTASHKSGTALAIGDVVSLSSATPGAVIRYTTNNSEPTANSQIYTSPIAITASIVIKAKAFATGLYESDMVSFAYSVMPRTATPTASSASGSTIPGGQKVTLYGESGATIRYTTNGSEPTENSDIYKSPIMIVSGKGLVLGKPEMTIKAKSFKSGMSVSDTAIFTYTVGDPVPMSLDLGTFSTSIPGNVPMIGGKTFELSFDKLPASLILDDDRFMVAIGYSFDLMKKEKSQPEVLEKFYEWRELISNSPYKNIVSKIVPEPSSKPFFGMKSTLHVAGYLEGAITKDGGLSAATGKLMLGFEVVGRNGWTVWIGPIPVAIEIDFRTAATFTGPIDFENLSRIVTKAALDAVIPELELRGGVGLAKIASLGVYGKAQLNFHWDFGTNYRRLWMYGDMGGYVKFLWWKWSKSFISGTWSIGEWYGAQSFQGIAGNAGVFSSIYDFYDLRNYSLAPRNYLGSQSPWLGNQVTRSRNVGEIKILQESVYDDTAPLIAEAGGTRVMVFLADDGSRDDMNRTKLMYSLYDAGLNTWSEPLAVFDDGTADFYPHISSDGNNIWLAWQKSKTVFAADAELEDVLTAAEIAVARFDFNTQMFTDVTVITDNDVMDTAPVIAVNGNEAFAVWVRNPENDIFGTEGTNNSIMSRRFTNDVWGETVTLENGLGAVVDMDAAYFNGQFQVAYVTDDDNDLETITDRNLVVIDSTGAATYAPVSGKLVSNPRFTTINNTQVLSWFENEVIIEEALEEDEEDFVSEGGNIRYMTANGQTNSMFDEPDMVADGFKIFSDNSGNTAVIYPAYENGKGYFYARQQYAGEWGQPFKLAETGDFARFFDGVWEDSGEFNLVFNNSRMLVIGEDDDAELFESNNLSTLRAVPPVNINLGGISYTSDDVRKGQPLPVSVDIGNTGGISVNNVDVKVNENLIGTFPISGGLLPGKTATIEFALNIPADMQEQTEFVISVEPGNLTDADMSDNSRVIVLGYSNLMLMLEKHDNEDKTVTVVANVENTSDFDVNAKLLVRIGSMDGDIIDIVNLGMIAGRNAVQSTGLSFDPRTLVPEGEEHEVLYFELISDKEYMSGKFDFVVLFAVEDIPEIVTTPVIGTVKSYNLDVPTTIRLLQDGDVKYSTSIEPAEGTGQQSQVFIFLDVQPGVYTLEITKFAHLSYIQQSLAVDEAGIILDEITLTPLENIRVTTLPTKTIYTAGQPLDLSGMVVTATYGDGSHSAVTGYNTIPAVGDMLNTIGKQTVIVNFEGKTDSFVVTVNDAPGADGRYTYEMDGVLYSSFDDLLRNIPDNTPATITLLKDVDSLLTIAGKTITFDLNGYDLTGGILATTGSDITLIGDVSGEVAAYGDGTIVNIQGDVYNVVSAYDSGTVLISGDVCGEDFSYVAAGNFGTVIISGDVYGKTWVSPDDGIVYGNVMVSTGGTVTIDGMLYVEDGNYYIMVDGQWFGRQGGVTSAVKPDYMEYTINGVSAVWVKIAGVLYGDVDGNGIVNPLDLLTLARYIARWPGIEINEMAADVDSNGSVNPLDLLILARHFAGWVGYETLPYIAQPASSQIMPLQASFSPFSFVSQPAAPVVNVSNAVGNVGDIVDVAVSLDDNPGIVSMRLNVNYNASVLRLLDVFDKGMLGEAYHRNVYASPYTLFWGNGVSPADFTFSGEVATLRFEILSETAGTPVSVSYAGGDGDILNFDLDKVYFEVHNGYVSALPLNEVTLVSAVPSASVKILNGNKNDLTITVIETYSDGSTNRITTTISINSNSAGSYTVGTYTVYVDTKGNDQIRRCYIVN